MKRLKKFDGRQKEEIDVELKCNYKQLNDSNKFIFLYTEDEINYEPIYQPFRGKKCSNYILDLTGKNFNILLRDWYSKNCKNIEKILTDNLKKKIKKYINPFDKNIEDINKEIITNKNKIFTKTTFEEYIRDENEKRIIYELSYYIQKYPKFKKLVKNASKDDQSKLMSMLNKIFNEDITIFTKTTEKISRKDFNSIPNERKICSLNEKKSCNQDIFCEYVDNKCKLKIPQRYKNEYFTKIVDYIIRYQIIRDQILNNTYDTIRNRFLFQSSAKNVFIN